MGRKIPGKKHRGVKDPEKQRQTRFNSLKDKINLAPTNPDEQYIPKSLTRLIELKDKTKQGEFDKKLKKNKNQHEFKLQRHKFESEKPTPIFKQFKDETDDNFMHRVTETCDDAIREAEFENKYGVDVKRDPKTGEVEAVVKRKKDQTDVSIKKEKKKKGKIVTKGKNITKGRNIEERLSKSQKRKKKLLERKLKQALNKKDEFEDYRDEIKFGEVAHAPPRLSAPKKAELVQNTQRPGKKDLLLKSALNGQTNPILNKVIDKKGKRKDLPDALRRQLDKQRDEIVSAYKELKAKKYTPH